MLLMQTHQIALDSERCDTMSISIGRVRLGFKHKMSATVGKSLDDCAFSSYPLTFIHFTLPALILLLLFKKKQCPLALADLI